MTSFQQILEDSLLTTSKPTSDRDLYYGDTGITEEELAQLRLAFETRLAVQRGTN